MKETQGEARPSRELTSKEQGGVHKEAAVTNPLVPLMRGEQGWYDRRHEELVRAFRNYVREVEQRSRGDFVPAGFIRVMISSQGDPRNRGEEDFCMQLALAWDVVAYDFYERGSFFEHTAGQILCDQYRHARVEAVKLSHPKQIRIIDALTEAVGIPHKRGQTEIEIPEKLRNYSKWVRSEEYKQRIDNAIAEREIRKTKSILGHIEPKHEQIGDS